LQGVLLDAVKILIDERGKVFAHKTVMPAFPAVN